jgi:hypothetical protein
MLEFFPFLSLVLLILKNKTKVWLEFVFTQRDGHSVCPWLWFLFGIKLQALIPQQYQPLEQVFGAA